MPRCSGGVSSTTASLAVGRKAASPRARGSWAANTRASPQGSSAERASSTEPTAKLTRLSARPVLTGQRARARPTGH